MLSSWRPAHNLPTARLHDAHHMGYMFPSADLIQSSLPYTGVGVGALPLQLLPWASTFILPSAFLIPWNFLIESLYRCLLFLLDLTRIPIQMRQSHKKSGKQLRQPTSPSGKTPRFSTEKA